MAKRIVMRTGEALVEAAEAGSAAEPEVVIGELDGPVGHAIANLIGDTQRGHGGRAAAALIPAAVASDRLTLFNTTSGIAQSRTVTIRVGQPDFFTEIFSAGDFDLAFTTVTFTPDGSPSFYRICRERLFHHRGGFYRV